jgi:hypothetical protein
MKTKLINYKIYNKLMKFVTSFYFADLSLTRKSTITRRVLGKTETLIKTKGSVEAAKYIKLCRLAVTKHLAGQKVDLPFGIALDRDLLPKLLPLNIRARIKEGDKLLIQWVLTLLQVSKLIKGSKHVVKTETMVEASSYKDSIPQYQIALVLNDMGLRRGGTSPK